MSLESNEIIATERAAVELVDDTQTFFAPASSDVLDALLGEYQLRRRQIDQVAALMRGDLGNVVHYFIEGNAGDEKFHRTLYVDRLFQVENAVHFLNSAYWSKALALTDIYECMPQDRKNAWNAQLRTPTGKKKSHSTYKRERAEEAGITLPEWEIEPLPEFAEGTVRNTIEALLVQRSQFLAEKVDGIFRALSGEHVTNAPEAFGKRMIVARILNCYGHTQQDRTGYLHDLRCVIAKFMGREEPTNRRSTESLVESARHRRGKWLVADGGALKLRVYKVGTAHIEVHPDMAWRLNQILAHMYPTAIPAEFRQRPPRRPKAVPAIGRPLPFAVLELLSARQYERRGAESLRTFQFEYDTQDGPVFDEACRVLASIGGTVDAPDRRRWRFDYVYGEALCEILHSGCIPDRQAHQFFPTPGKLAAICAEWANVQAGERCLEPSAGQGDLAAFLPADRTVCVEISPLHCAVLKARGFETLLADFLGMPPTEAYDVVVMNPPFADGRAHAHVEHAARFVRPGGRLVAILPASAQGKTWLKGPWACEWSQVYRNEFAGTSAAVVILRAVRAA